MQRMARRIRFRRLLWFGLLLATLLAAGYTLYLDVRVREEFEGRRFALPARIYARPLELHADVARDGCRLASRGELTARGALVRCVTPRITVARTTSRRAMTPG